MTDEFKKWFEETYGPKQMKLNGLAASWCWEAWHAAQALLTPVRRLEINGAADNTIAKFNHAIDFAIAQGSDAQEFLNAWRHGDTSDWPEFKALTAAEISKSLAK